MFQRSAHRLVRGIIVILCVWLGACSSRYEAPIEDEPIEAAPRPRARIERDVSRTGAGSYVIRSGDTLYSIAWRNNLDFKDVARWNGIKPPYRIYAGQRLRLTPPGSTADTPANRTAITKRESSATMPAERTVTPSADNARSGAAPAAPALRESPPPSSAKTSENIRWQWPARGRYEAADSVRGERGINIFGAKGSPVVAAAAGRVVYSGSGLVGYGKLIIIEHNDTYLSAYAHNDKLLVAEGARVVGGQQIAEMGSTGARQVMLHFEIRRGGKPVPPLEFLP